MISKCQYVKKTLFCLSSLDKYRLMRCTNLLSHTRTVISLDLCSFCLSNEQISTSQRLRAWTHNYFLMKHVNNDIPKIRFFKFLCAHSRCREQLNDLSGFRHHLVDIHELTKSQKKAFDAQRAADVEKNAFNSIIGISAKPKRHGIRKRKRKCNDQDDSIFVVWSSSVSFYSSSLWRSLSLRRLFTRRAAAYKKNPTKRRRVESNEKQYESTLDEESCSASWKSSNITTELNCNENMTDHNLSDSCVKLSEHESSLTHTEDGVQANVNLTVLPQPCQIDTLMKGSRKPVLQKSSFFECVSLPVDPALLSWNEPSVLKTPSTQAHEENIVSEKSHALLERRHNRFMNVAATSEVASGLSSKQEILIEEFFSLTRFADDESRENSPSGSSKMTFDDHQFKCPLCERAVSFSTHKKPMRFSQQKAFCERHQKRDAEREWIRLNYSRIIWRRLNARMFKKIAALRHIVKERSFFFLAKIQTSFEKQKARKYRCINNKIAGHYGPREEQIMWVNSMWHV